MGICLLWAGFSFFIPADASGEVSPAGLGSIAAAIYTFMAVYSPGEGPVPFTYSAEAFPLYIRDVGMSFATATTWGFNFILSLTWPPLVRAFTPTGAFAWYAAWNFVGWVYCYFLLPETKVCSQSSFALLGIRSADMLHTESYFGGTGYSLRGRKQRTFRLLQAEAALVHGQVCSAQGCPTHGAALSSLRRRQ